MIEKYGTNFNRQKYNNNKLFSFIDYNIMKETRKRIYAIIVIFGC